MIIVWSDTAEKSLNKIYNYYLKETSVNIAKKLISGILN